MRVEEGSKVISIEKVDGEKEEEAEASSENPETENKGENAE